MSKKSLESVKISGGKPETNRNMMWRRAEFCKYNILTTSVIPSGYKRIPLGVSQDLKTSSRGQGCEGQVDICTPVELTFLTTMENKLNPGVEVGRASCYHMTSRRSTNVSPSHLHKSAE